LPTSDCPSCCEPETAGGRACRGCERLEMTVFSSALTGGALTASPSPLGGERDGPRELASGGSAGACVALEGSFIGIGQKLPDSWRPAISLTPESDCERRWRPPIRNTFHYRKRLTSVSWAHPCPFNPVKSDAGIGVSVNFSPGNFPRQHNNLKRGLKLRPVIRP
jgi:hypothetical protein